MIASLNDSPGLRIAPSRSAIASSSRIRRFVLLVGLGPDAYAAERERVRAIALKAASVMKVMRIIRGLAAAQRSISSLPIT